MFFLFRGSICGSLGLKRVKATNSTNIIILILLETHLGAKNEGLHWATTIGKSTTIQNAWRKL